MGKAYEFIICSHAAKDKAVAFGGAEFQPFLFVLGIDVVGVILDPIYTGGLCVADVGYVVDVTLMYGLGQRIIESGEMWIP